jgi:hypothetical protein
MTASKRALRRRLFTGVVLLSAFLGAAYFVLHRTAAPVGVVHLPGVEISSVLSRQDFKRNNWVPEGQFNVTESGLILLLSRSNIFNVITAEPILEEPRSDITSFCTVSDGIVAVCGDSLCAYDSGRLLTVATLPSARMSVASSGEQDGFYLYQNLPDGSDVYSFSSGAGYVKLFHISAPVSALTGSGGRVYLATPGRILTWKSGELPYVIFDVGKSVLVESLAFDPDNGILYFSSGEGVFALANGRVLVVLAGATGEIQFSHQVLFIRDRVQESLLAASGVSQAVVRR